MIRTPVMLRAAFGAFAAIVLAACGGSSSAEHGAGSCPAPDQSVVAAAVSQYIQGISPAPQRFLLLPTGDSALPDAAREALQNEGPTFLFTEDTAKQSTVLAHLKEEGVYPTLLILYGGTRQLADGTAEVRLSARYVMGADKGAKIPAGAVHFSCVQNTWRLSDTTHAGGAVAAGPTS